MKAEHRKNLETNSLAEGVGKLLHQVKKPKDRSLVLYLIVAAVVVGVVFMLWLVRSRRVEQGAEQWLYLDNAGQNFMRELMKEGNDTNQAKAARFQFAWIKLWENGIKSIGSEPDNSLRMLDALTKEYGELADSCKGDPVFEPEALYAIAVIEETRAIQDRRQLDIALAKYKDLAKNHPKSAHGVEAAKRAEVLEDSKQRAEIVEFYQKMQENLRIPPPGAAQLFNDKKNPFDKIQAP